VGFKTFVAGEILTASDTNTFLAKQMVATFADATARDAGIPSPTHGQFVFLPGTQVLQFFDGSDWTEL
jgi:hypothetical protein